MRFRDYLFWSILAFALVGALRAPAAAPVAPPASPRASLWWKATYWLATWRLAHDRAPQSPPQTVQELPDAVVNAPAERIVGPDGSPLLAHGQGW